MKEFYHIDDFDIAGKVVILRTDFNVPIVKGRITDQARITRSMKTIRHLIKLKAKIVLLSHFGQPKGKFDPDMSLSPIVDAVSEQLSGKEIHFVYDILSKSAEQNINTMKNGNIVIAENIRFHAEEEENNHEFAKKIASLGDYYVNDAFSCSHRKHASIDAITYYLPSAIGLLYLEEVHSLDSIMSNSKDIFAITGGAKVSSKIALLKNLVKKVRFLAIGGAMANTFLKAQGHEVGKSLYEENHISTAQKIFEMAKKNECELILPVDVVTSIDIDDVSNNSRVVDIDQVNSSEMILDLGIDSIIKIVECLKKTHTVIWNGPLGAFEYKPFDIGTTTISRAISKLTLEKKITSVAGGGDVVSAITEAGLDHNFSYVSTGGGAFLAWLEGKPMPAMVALKQSYANSHSSN